MKGSFSEIISASIEWTKTILFRPFRFKKWLMLYIIVLFAFQMQGGCNFNFDLPSSDSQKTSQAENLQQEVEPDIATTPFGKPINKTGKGIIILVIVLFTIAIALIFLLLEWIYSVFSFVFIECVINNDTSIKKPFIKNKILGNSYFAWNIAYMFAMFVIFGILGKLGYNALFRLGVFEKGSSISFGTIILSVLPYILIASLIVTFSLLLSFFIINFVLIVMYKDRLTIIKAMKPAFSLLCSDLVAVVKYIFVQMGLWIVASLITTLISFCVLIALFIPGALVAIVLFGIYKIMPLVIQPIYTGVLLIIGVPLMIALLFFINMIFLPFPVFFKTFNLKFIARIDEKYNLFRLS